MIETVGTLKTTIVSDKDKKHVYEICREFDTEENNEVAIILTLYPTTADVSKLDLTAFHTINHASDSGLKFKKIHTVFLFSEIVNGKPSSKKLVYDEKNMEYLKELITRLPNAKLIIAYGSCYEKNSVVIESKVKFFAMLKDVRENAELWQLDCESMEGEQEAMHFLYAGVRYGSSSWYLRHYVIPYRYTEAGYKEYLANKEIARQRFIQNVLGKKETSTKNDEKAKKGKKKDVLQN